MDRKMLTIVLAIALIGAFFLPYVNKVSSGYDAVTASGANWETYVWLITPVAGLLLLLGALNKEGYILGRGLLTWLPLLTLLFIVIWAKLQYKADLGNMIKGMGYGYWISLIAAVLLAFYNPRAKAA